MDTNEKSEICHSQTWQKVTTAVPAEFHSHLEEYAEWAFDRTLFAIFGTLEKRDPIAAGHSIRVRRYCLLVAEQMSLSQIDCKILAYSALLHDLGKIGIPESILWKPTELRPQERDLFEKHAQWTYELLERLPFPSDFADVPFIASCHHEKLDGSGYYRGLKGEQIPPLARILIVAHEFDDLTSAKHSHDAMSIARAKTALLDARQSFLDAEIVDIFVAIPNDELKELLETGPNFVLS